MIEFKPITLEQRKLYESYLLDGTERGCDYSFVNLYLWGRQRAATGMPMITCMTSITWLI